MNFTNRRDSFVELGACKLFILREREPAKITREQLKKKLYE
jgi:hypothetical protein